MPKRPLHPCSRCTVNLTANRGPCDTCARHVDHARGTSSQRGYGTMHRKRRMLVLHRDPFCVACDAVSKLEASTVYDHIVPIEAGGDASDLDNAQGLCARCHNRKRHAESRGRQLQVIEGEGMVDIGPLGTPAHRPIMQRMVA